MIEIIVSACMIVATITWALVFYSYRKRIQQLDACVSEMNYRLVNKADESYVTARLDAIKKRREGLDNAIEAQNAKIKILSDMLGERVACICRELKNTDKRIDKEVVDKHVVVQNTEKLNDDAKAIHELQSKGICFDIEQNIIHNRLASLENKINRTISACYVDNEIQKVKEQLRKEFGGDVEDKAVYISDGMIPMSELEDAPVECRACGCLLRAKDRYKIPSEIIVVDGVETIEERYLCGRCEEYRSAKRKKQNNVIYTPIK